MNRLETKIRDKINFQGHITVDEFMSMALFDPDHGYYISKDPLGPDGDFTTSPEISVLFGEMIGLFIVSNIQKNLSNYDKINLIELGAGRGTLLNDILNTCRMYNDIYQKFNVYILEINPILVEKQRRSVTDHKDKVKWVNDLSDIDSPSPHIYISNEFLDALPIKQFIKESGLIYERVIKLNNSGNFTFGRISANIPEVIRNDASDYEDGAIIEYSAAQIGFMQKICADITEHKGFFLMIDYGYADFVTGDTLQSVKDHKYNNIFTHIGEADLTAQVNFRMLYNIVLQNGITDIYLQTQADFLNSLGISMRAERLSQGLDEKQKSDLFLRVNRLINSTQMGTLFKCLIAEKF